MSRHCSAANRTEATSEGKTTETYSPYSIGFLAVWTQTEMENRHLADHNPISGHTTDSSTNSGAAPNMEDMVEFRIMMAYAQRRRPKTDSGSSGHVGDASSPKMLAETEGEVKGEKNRKPKKRRFKALRSVFSCVKPQPELEESSERINFRHLSIQHEEDKLDMVASTLTTIADEIPFSTPEIESDCDGNVEKLIGLLLREKGDEFNQSVLKDMSLRSDLSSYGFFASVITTFLERMGFDSSSPDALGPQGSPKTQFALTCEVASRLSAVDTLPMSRLLGFGAEYLHSNFSAWATQHGGYEKVFDGEDDEEVN
ncbi:uncharacterized protein LOC143008325 isoform X2 [Genypterus blacodes]|uniref:uncharacterized protein LOC143008325 isoform X2 n=1 Tax=Genypterus blacodes TaxID=154954 RepID=UPI003F761CC4